MLVNQETLGLMQIPKLSKEKYDGPKLSLNVFMDKEKSKVLFAEADCQFVDVLLSFLTLPLGKIVKILKKHYNDETPVFPSLHTLQKGLSDFKHFCFREAFEMLENPISSLVEECCKLKLDISGSRPTRYYVCQNKNCVESPFTNVSMKYGNVGCHDAVFCDCGMELNRQGMFYVFDDDVYDDDEDDEDVDDDVVGVFTKQDSSFIIFDDLCVVPNAKTLLETLNNFGIEEYDEAQMVTLDLGISDIRDLFRLALFSGTPLTDFAIKNKITAAVKPDLFIPRTNFVIKNKIPAGAKPDSFNLTGENLSFFNSSPTMILTVSLQKSTDKFLFAHSKADFVEFLFSLLTLPIANIESLFGGSTSFKSLDNLYGSARKEIDYKYFTSPHMKDMLMNPFLPYGYRFRNTFLILNESRPTPIYLLKEKNSSTFHYEKRGKFVSLKKRRGRRFFVEENTVCIVRDDLTVAPYSVASAISLLKGMGIPLSDVKEIELRIGFEEALSILKAALTSNTVLSDALINPMLKNMKN